MWIVYLMIALAILLGVAIIVIFIRYKLDYWRFLDVPHEKPKTIREIFRERRAINSRGGDQLASVDVAHINELYQRFKGTGPFCGFYQMLRPAVLVLDRELCKQILINDFANFNDRGHYYHRKRDPLAAHLFNLRGKSWQEMRPRVETLLGEDALKYIFEGIDCECHNLLNYIERTFEENEEPQQLLKMQPLIARNVSDTLATCIFGLKSNDIKYSLAEFYEMVQEALKAPLRHGRYIQSLLYTYPSLSKKLGLALTASKVHNFFMELIMDIVSQREMNKLEIVDFMQLLINMKHYQFHINETDDREDAAAKLQQRLFNELAAHAYGFVQVGFEATTKTLSYALLELALQEELQQRVRKEVQLAKEQHGGRLDYECVIDLELLGQVLQETVRLHPIKPYLTRKTLSDYRVSSNSKYLLTKNMFVIIPVHAIHNDPDNFPEPHLFRPERFAAQSMRTRAVCTWLGFGEGPRNCLAQRFVQMQMRLTLALLLQSYSFRVDLTRPMPSLMEGIELIVQRIEN